MIFGLLLLLPLYISGQQCADYLKNSCAAPDEKEFKQFNIFRAASVEVNKPNLCSVALPPNKDYLIKFCSDSKYKPLKIKLIDKKLNQILYDNSTDEYKEFTAFTVVDNPINLIIEITVSGNTSNEDNYEIERVCAGFRIFLKKRLE